MQTASLLFLGLALGGDPPTAPAPSFTDQATRSPAIPDCGAPKLRHDTTVETVQRLLMGLFPNSPEFAPRIGDPLPPPRKPRSGDSSPA
jgi:hypothetical protein